MTQTDNTGSQVQHFSWSVADKSVIAERNSLDRWSVYAEENGDIISPITNNLSHAEVLDIITKYKQTYLYDFTQ